MTTPTKSYIISNSGNSSDSRYPIECHKTAKIERRIWDEWSEFLRVLGILVWLRWGEGLLLIPRQVLIDCSRRVRDRHPPLFIYENRHQLLLNFAKTTTFRTKAVDGILGIKGYFRRFSEVCVVGGKSPTVDIGSLSFFRWVGGPHMPTFGGPEGLTGRRTRTEGVCPSEPPHTNIWIQIRPNMGF